ncbi:MAG: histidine kinase dimerization/phospho-acceptor domain-containing protein [Thermoleophilaceae bacterium]
MRRRLVSSTAVIALASVFVLGVPLGLVESARVRSDAAGRLEREADAVAGAIDDRLEAGQALVPAQLSRYVKSGHRVQITTRDGARLGVGSPIRGGVTRARAGTSRGAVVVAEAPTSEARARVTRAWLLIASLAVGGVAAAIGLAFVQARRLAQPLESLAHSSARLGAGDFSMRAGRFSIPEVDALARVLDGSAERIARLVAREREFSANVSHQLRTPITALRLRLEELGLRTVPAEDRAELDAALAEMDRLEATISDLLAYARRESAGQAVDLDLAELVRQHAATWRLLFARAGRHLNVLAPIPVPARASAGAIGQVLDVLLDNALAHGGGLTTISVEVQGGRALVAVEDEGPGIAPAAAVGIFERGSSESGGTGIGLHLAHVLAASEGGQLRLVRAAPPRFELLLPDRRTATDGVDRAAGVRGAAAPVDPLARQEGSRASSTRRSADSELRSATPAASIESRDLGSRAVVEGPVRSP